MKRKPYLSLLLALVMLGVMLLLVPQWWMLVVIALIALVTTQVIIVRRHLYRLPSGHSRMPMPQTAPQASPSGPDHAAEAGPGADDVGGSESGAQPMVDRELFSRFRRHLELAEKGAGAGSAGDSEATLSDAALVDPAQVEDRVELSQAARRPPAGRAQREKASRSSQQPSALPAGPPAEEESGDGPDIFEDLRPPPPIAPRTKRPQRAARRATPPPAAPPAQRAPASAGTGDAAADARSVAGGTVASPAGDSPASAGDADTAGRPTDPRGEAPAQEEVDEVAAALTTETSPAGLEEEARALLKLAQEATAREDWDGARAALKNYLAHLAGQPRLIDWRARQIQLQLALRDGDLNGALQGFEEMLSAGYAPSADGVPRLLDALFAGEQGAGLDGLRVSMLVRILAVFRQSRDQQAMDRAYGWIEEAQERVGDERRLLQYLRNHLEIRKAMGDVPGQLELIDQIGNRCYKLGLTEEARQYYEMGLKLREEPHPQGEGDPGAATPEGGGGGGVRGRGCFDRPMRIAQPGGE